MKVLHCCLAAFYIDDMGYQENILPLFHKQDGHNVRILASTETYLENTTLGYVRPSSYLNEDEIEVTRISYVRWLPHFMAKKLRIYVGVYDYLCRFQPDVIFLHDTQFLSARAIAKYCKRNPNVKLFADGHTDFINSARSFVSREVLHKLIYRYCAKVIEPYASKFFGTNNLRCKFIREVYGIDDSKIEMLPFGLDDNLLKEEKDAQISEKLRLELGIPLNDLLILSGGKIDARKNILTLMEAVKGLDDVSLLIFGEPVDEIHDAFFELLRECENIFYVGWSSQIEICRYGMAADIACFPGTHSVVWEQMLGLGLPCIFKKWAGMEHLMNHDSVWFLEVVNATAIELLLKSLRGNDKRIEMAKCAALEFGKKRFRYSSIARRAIGEAQGD